MAVRLTSAGGRHFDRLAPDYSRLRAAEGRDPVTDVVARLGVLRGRRVLDVACGSGAVLRRLGEEFAVRGVGVDRSERMIEAARREAGEAAELHVGRAERLPLPDGSVDAAVMRMVVHHVDRPRAFAELCRVVRPGGRVVVTTTDPAGFPSFWLRPYFPSYVAIEQARFPDGETLRRELTGAGFVGVEVVPQAVPRRFARETALEKLRGRAYSTFALIGEEEYRAGLAAAEAELPAEVEYELTLLHVVATRR